jgi:hypothetical protein
MSGKWAIVFYFLFSAGLRTTFDIAVEFVAGKYCTSATTVAAAVRVKKSQALTTQIHIVVPFGRLPNGSSTGSSQAKFQVSKCRVNGAHSERASAGAVSSTSKKYKVLNSG